MRKHDFGTNGRSSHSSSVAKSPLKPHRRIWEPLQEEVSKYRMEMVHQFLWRKKDQGKWTTCSCQI